MAQELSGSSSLVSTSPFRKLRIAESEYGIEVDMYGISRGVVFEKKNGNRRSDTYGFHGFTDSVRIPPKTDRHSPTPQPPRTGPLPRARGIPPGLEPNHGVGQAAGNLLPLAQYWRSTNYNN
jgi:hypothetical protein